MANLFAGTVRSDITSDIVTSAGKEELLPWRLAPIRVLAIIATVGLGGPMGTEAPAAYLGVARERPSRIGVAGCAGSSARPPWPAARRACPR